MKANTMKEQVWYRVTFYLKADDAISVDELEEGIYEAYKSLASEFGTTFWIDALNIKEGKDNGLS